MFDTHKNKIINGSVSDINQLCCFKMFSLSWNFKTKRNQNILKMKSIVCLFFIGLIGRAIAEPVCTFAFDGDVYFCPLTGGDIEADFDGEIDGTHYNGKFVTKLIQNIKQPNFPDIY
jgi:hypothetical protein